MPRLFVGTRSTHTIGGDRSQQYERGTLMKMRPLTPTKIGSRLFRPRHFRSIHLATAHSAGPQRKCWRISLGVMNLILSLLRTGCRAWHADLRDFQTPRRKQGLAEFMAGF